MASMSFEPFTDDHRPLSSEVFLDTSIHCSGFKGPLFQDRIERVLRVFMWKGTSSYAKVEFGNVVLSSAEYYLRKLEEHGSLEATLDYIGNVLVPQFHGKLIQWSFNFLRNHYGANDAECTERARLSLQLLMRVGVALVEQKCDTPMANGTNCYWARKGVHRRRDGTLTWKTPRCTARNKRCAVDDFFVQNRETFLAIKQAIDRLPQDRLTAQLRAFSDVISKALGNPRVLLDYRTGCKRLADAIIAVDSVAYRSLFSQNARESEVLTEVLQQVFYYLPPNPSKGVQIKIPGNVGPCQIPNGGQS